MNRSAVIALVLVLGVLALTQDKKTHKSKRNVPLFSGVDLNRIAKLKIEPARGQALTILKTSDSQWKVLEKKNFPADPNKVSELLRKLFLLKQGDRVTSGEKHFAQYGVDGSNVPGISGTGLSLHESSGTTLSAVLLGNQRLSKGKFGFDTPSGQYVRKVSEEVIYLLKEPVQLQTSPSHWIHKEFPSIEGKDLAQIKIETAQEDKLRLFRLDEEKDFQLEGLSSDSGLSLKQSEVQNLASVFSKFSFEDLLNVDSEDVQLSMTQTTKVEYTTMSGLKLTAHVGVKAGSANRAAMKLRFENVGQSADVAKLVKEYEEQFGGWALAVSEFSAKKFVKTSEDLTQASPVGAQHILVSYKGSSGAQVERSKEEALELANSILKRIQDGEDFAALAKEFSDDASNKDKGGDLGTFNRGDMVKPFEAAVYGAKVDELVSNPVETVFGYHIIKRTK